VFATFLQTLHLQEVEATDESAIYERAMWDRLPLPCWSAAAGRVVLLGDAAHAMYSGPGQGARTAFEDAHQMFLAIKQHWPNPAAVAAQYEVRCRCASWRAVHCCSPASAVAAFWGGGCALLVQYLKE
jgi:2-polyprenyl-6-methoxyphenol hydroxylase-like FAD-dependent oxidoreductase